MDELFRKAAAGYPLKTDNSDWDSLQSRLLIPPAAPDVNSKKSRFNKYGLPLLLVVLMLFSGGRYSPYSLKHKGNTGKDVVLSNRETTTAKQQQKQQQQQSQQSQALLKSGTTVTYKTARAPENEILLYTNPGVERTAGKTIKTVEVPDLTYNMNALVNASNITSAGTVRSFQKPNSDGQKEKKKVDNIERPAKIYWGIVVGPGINRVKKQKIRKPGFDAGIMAGLPLLKGKAAVEVGLLYTQKYYFSEGKYFNMDKAGGSMPQGMEIICLEGSSRLFELPVKFKYNVWQKNRSGVSLSTGISSYLMTSEENDYRTMMNGSEQTMVGSYKNSKRYIAVTANFGAEFNYKTGKYTRLSIEPYFQIPLKGIGIGSMPVMTTGIHFGFMRLTP